MNTLSSKIFSWAAKYEIENKGKKDKFDDKVLKS